MYTTIYREWMNEKTMIKDPKTGAWTRVWTHHNVRKAYNSLNHLWRSEMLEGQSPFRAYAWPRPISLICRYANHECMELLRHNAS